MPPSILSSATKLSTSLLRARGGGWNHSSVTEKGPVSTTVRLIGAAGNSVWVKGHNPHSDKPTLLEFNSEVIYNGIA